MFFSRFSLPCVASGTVHVLMIVIIAAIPATAPAQTTIQARSADQFIDSMGVNVHMEYLNTPYKNYPAINQKLQSLGMRHIRDEINDPSESFAEEIRQIGNFGYTLCGLIEGGGDYPPSGRLNANDVVGLISRLKPAIEAVEGPNEPDGGGFVYDGVPYPQGAINESEDLWTIVKGNPATSDLPVLAMSEANPQDFTQLAAITPPPIYYATYGNMHAYQGAWIGDSNLSSVYIPYARDLTGNDPLWTTEMGYHNNTHYLSDQEQQGVSPRAAAIYLPIAFFSGFNHGVLRTFSYELIDEVNDPNLTSGSGNGHYGLLNYDGTLKPAFTALKNLITILREPGTFTFEPRSLEVTFSGVPAAMRYTLLQKSSGDLYLAVWNDISVYQPAQSPSTPGKDIYPPNVPVRISFSESYAFTVYAPNDSTGINPTGAYTLSTTSDSIELSLPPQVLLIKIVAE
jgi:hypothetical protein